MPLPFKPTFPSILINCGWFCKKILSFQVTSSIGSFFHLMRYLVIYWFPSFLIYVLMIVSSFSNIFPSSSSYGKIAWIGILSLIINFVTSQIVRDDEIPNLQGEIQGKPLGRSPLSWKQPILCCFKPTLLWIKGGYSILGLLRPSNEAQGDIESSLSKTRFGVFKVFLEKS